MGSGESRGDGGFEVVEVGGDAARGHMHVEGSVGLLGGPRSRAKQKSLSPRVKRPRRGWYKPRGTRSHMRYRKDGNGGDAARGHMHVEGSVGLLGGPRSRGGFLLRGVTPEGQAPKKGLVQAARDEIAHEVQEGWEAARAGVGPP
jgi:hypothetical protein